MLNVNSEYVCRYFLYATVTQQFAAADLWSPHRDLTWQWLTDLTALSREALRAVATVTIPFLQAASTMETRVGLAWIILHCQERQHERGGGEVNWIHQVSFYS